MKTSLMLSLILALYGCKMKEINVPMNELNRYRPIPLWAQDATIYEVNIRQYTPEGSLLAFGESLPRLKEMGVKILWFMPIYPVSEKNRKGSLGSYYSISDFRKINPEFGTLEDFKKILAQAHALDMKVILDMVPNHTGWDHPWIEQHPDWYTQDSLGHIISPLDPWSGQPTGWTDVADLNYNNPEMRRALINDYHYWVDEVGIDGYRMDMAHFVPLDFWHEVRQSLDSSNKELFFLAESELGDHLYTGLFHANYAWPHHHLMNDVAKGHKPAAELRSWILQDQYNTPKGGHMYFLSNHDENSWSGSEIERMGPAYKAFAVHTFTIGGIPLIYSGMEEPMVKRLEFFDKDTIPFSHFENQAFYQSLIHLRNIHPALHFIDAENQARFLTDDPHILIYKRVKARNEVIVILNLSGVDRQITLNIDLQGYLRALGNHDVQSTLLLSPWSYNIWTKG